MAKNAIAVRKSSGALTKAKTDLAKTRSAYASYRRKVKDSSTPGALMGAGATLTGAAACGAAKALLETDEFMGIPLEPIGGLVLGTLGVALDQPLLIHAGAGFMAPYVHDFVAELVADA